MNTENLKKIQQLMTVANEIKSGFDKWDKYKKTPSHYDKTGMGFNLDGRFQACEPLKLWVASWVGVYGDSNCSNVISVDSEIFNKYLLQVLKGKFNGIMNEVSAAIIKDAQSMAEKANKEVADIKKYIDDLTELIPN